MEEREKYIFMESGAQQYTNTGYFIYFNTIKVQLKEPRESLPWQEVNAEKKKNGRGGEIKQAEALWKKESNITWGKKKGQGI